MPPQKTNRFSIPFLSYSFNTSVNRRALFAHRFDAYHARVWDTRVGSRMGNRSRLERGAKRESKEKVQSSPLSPLPPILILIRPQTEAPFLTTLAAGYFCTSNFYRVNCSSFGSKDSTGSPLLKNTKWERESFTYTSMCVLRR